jgi:organic radical activating enzyme
LCDTHYTSWFPDDKKNLGEVDLEFIINEYKTIDCTDVVITGGEPTMYPDELLSLCKRLKESNKNILITIETNGTSAGEFMNHIDLASISPKLRSSVPFDTEYEKMHEKNRINLDVLRKFHELHQKGVFDIQWKFVFTSGNDIDEIRYLQREIGFENKDVYLMPEGITKEELSSRRLKIIETCKENNFNYTDRLHILVW